MSGRYSRRSVLYGAGSSIVLLAGCSSTDSGSGDGGQSTQTPGRGTETSTDTPAETEADSNQQAEHQTAEPTPEGGSTLYKGSYFRLTSTDRSGEYRLEVAGWPDAYRGDIGPEDAAYPLAGGEEPILEERDSGYDSGNGFVTPGMHEADWIVPCLWADGFFNGDPRLIVMTVPKDGSYPEDRNLLYNGSPPADRVTAIDGTGFTVGQFDPAAHGWQQNDDSVVGLLTVDGPGDTERRAHGIRYGDWNQVT